MKKLIVISILFTLLVALIPYNVEAHTSCNMKLIRREKELIALIKELTVEKNSLAPFVEQLRQEVTHLMFACMETEAVCGALSVKESQYNELKAQLDSINLRITRNAAELKYIQSLIKKSCKKR